MSVDQALEHVRKRRSCVEPNEGKNKGEEDFCNPN